MHRSAATGYLPPGTWTHSTSTGSSAGPSGRERRRSAGRGRDGQGHGRSETSAHECRRCDELVEDLRALVDQLTVAIESRAPIEQAKGVLVARTGCTPDQAFDLLRRASQRANRKLRDIAAEIVHRAAGGAADEG